MARPRLHRSYLYAPGSNPGIVAKALTAGADAVVLDLEDAVAPAEKAEARRQVAWALGNERSSSDLHVRINRTPQGFDLDDVRAVVQPGLQALRLPKVETRAHLRGLDEMLIRQEDAAGMPTGSVALYPTVESAVGAVRLAEVVQASARVARVAFGAADFLADIGAIGDDDLATVHVRSNLVLTSRAAGIGPPIDSVHTRLDDLDGLRDACLRARALGFFGKSVIHPSQLPVVHQAFTPNAGQLNWAREVVRALDEANRRGHGAVAVDGEFIDAAVVERAKALLAIGEANQ